MVILKSFDNDIASGIQYLINGYKCNDYELLGLMKVEGDLAHIGQALGGDNYCAAYLSKKPMRKCVSDDKKNEIVDISSGLTYALILTGTDNFSYVKRFSSFERGVKWYQKCPFVSSADGLRWLNS